MPYMHACLLAVDLVVGMVASWHCMPIDASNARAHALLREHVWPLKRQKLTCVDACQGSVKHLWGQCMMSWGVGEPAHTMHGVWPWSVAKLETKNLKT